MGGYNITESSRRVADFLRERKRERKCRNARSYLRLQRERVESM